MWKLAAVVLLVICLEDNFASARKHYGRDYGCPHGWVKFGTQCYFFSADKKDWYSARATCAAMGSWLVNIESKAESNFLTNEMRHRYKDFFDRDAYTGGNNLANVLKWVWDSDQEPICALEKNCKGFTNWGPGKPEVTQLDRCLELETDDDFKWDSGKCAGLEFYICEKHQGCDPVYLECPPKKCW